MSYKDTDKRKEYMKNLMRKRRADKVIIVEPIELNPVTLEVKIIDKYKECLLLQLTHNNFMIWLTLNNLVNIELIELYEPYLFKKEWNFRMKPCLKSVIEWAK